VKNITMKNITMKHKIQKRVNIVDLIRIETEKSGRKPAVTGTCGTCITYNELSASVKELSYRLLKAGFSSHDRVALFCEDSIEYIITALAILDTQAVIVPVSPSLSSREMENLCSRIKVKYILSEKKITRYHVLPGNYLNKLNLYKTDDNVKYSKNYDRVPFPAFIRFSSGTTGRSKGVLLTHDAIIERTAAANARLDISSSDVIGWFLSMSFHFVVSILLFLRKGAHIVLSHDNFPTGIINSFKKNNPTFLYASPFHYKLLANYDIVSDKLLSGVRMAVVTAVSLNMKTEQEFFNKFHIHLSQAYGIIEVGLPFINDNYDEQFICSVGKIVPGFEVKIRDPDQNGRGIIMIRGKGMFYGYISPWKIHTGWFNTQDIGFIKDLHLFICGRQKNLINFAGMKIFPEEVEEAILEFDNIEEVKVFPEKHDIYGQLPVAEIVLSQKKEINTLKLKKHCLNKLDSYKIPKEFRIVESIEKTTSNKIKRT